MLHCSDEIFRIYGVDPRKGVPTFDLLMQRVHPDDRDRVRGITLEGIREKAERFLEYRLVLPDGALKYIESVRRPVLDRKGNVVEVVGTSVDVTERKRAEQERDRLRKLEADLVHVDRISMLGELVASLAHEVRQPIAAAITNARTCLRWLADDQPNLAEARAAGMRVEQSLTRATEIFERLRSFYRKDTADQRQRLAVNEVIREITTLLRSEAVRNSLSFRFDLAEGIPAVIADRVQLQQVLVNLVLNAIEAMKDTGGEVTIGSRPDAGAQVLIWVSDTGVGLPADNAERVFDPFFTTKPQGTGMGLAITRSLVQSHGGRLWAEANAGPGATFYFTLPSHAEEYA